MAEALLTHDGNRDPRSDHVISEAEAITREAAIGGPLLAGAGDFTSIGVGLGSERRHGGMPPVLGHIATRAALMNRFTPPIIY